MPIVAPPVEGTALSVDNQVRLRDVLMGAGTAVEIQKITGLGMPPLRTSDLERVTTDGSFGGRDLKAPMVITVEMELWGATHAALASLLSSLTSAWAPSQTDIMFSWRLPGFPTRKVYGRPRGFTWERDVPADFGRVQPAIGVFVAPNPRIYDLANGTEVPI